MHLLLYITVSYTHLDVYKRQTNPKWEDRDRFVLSKGHVAPGLYSTLAEKGYFPRYAFAKISLTCGI